MTTLLVFDVFVTNTPLFPNFEQTLYESNLKNDESSYRFFDREDITLYTLISYSKLNFDEALILIEFENKEIFYYYKKIIIDLFPKVTILNKRSTKPLDFDFLSKFIQKTKNKYIYYSPNNDHPFINSDIKNYSKFISLLDVYSKTYKNVSLIYSHFQETLEGFTQNTWLNIRQFYDSNTIVDDEDHILVQRKKGYSVGMQVVTKDLFLAWCELAKGLHEKTNIKRLDDLFGKVELPQQYIIIPKIELCRHFDGYYHTMFVRPQIGLLAINAEKIPPLFIPFNFFEKKVVIKYGYREYFPGFTNINPSATSYIFEDFQYSDPNKTYTDIKIDIKEIPFFWEDYIERIDYNELYVPDHKNIEHNTKIQFNPWHGDALRNSNLFKIKNHCVRLYLYLKNLELVKLLIKICRIFFVRVR